MNKTIQILGMLGVSAVVPAALVVGAVLNATALPQAVITEAGVQSVIIAETGSIRDGLPVGVKLTRYNFTTNAGIGAFDGRPATRFCRSTGFPSNQKGVCRYSTEPFDPNAVGKQQPVNFNTWVAVSS